MALWGGRFTQEADQKFKFFNDSLRFDYRLALQDIDGSIGWAKAITSVGVLTEEEHQQLVAALKELRAEIEPKIEIILKDDAEDIHSWVESKLIEKVGDLGKKLHTGRSRNDQVAVDMKMWCKAQVIVMRERIRNLQEKLVLTAEASQHAVMPGYTHLQRAQPITFAHWCMAYFEMLERDYSRLTDAYKRMYTCPLGSGALAGTAYAVDRDALAKDLGFSIGTRNSLDSVSDRDHVLELLSSASISMVHLSRFAEDLIFFNSGESAFLELSDRVTSGSSLMPQKKNPDAHESYQEVKNSLRELGVTPRTTYLYIQGHHLFNKVVAPLMEKICFRLYRDRESEIKREALHVAQYKTELAGYNHSIEELVPMLKKNVGFMASDVFSRLKADLRSVYPDHND